MVFVPHFLAPQNPFELFKFLANSSFGNTVHFTYQTFFKRKKKCILFISRVCSCLDRLRLRQKDSNLIFAWNSFYRLFIIVLRYISSFATVDVNLTHSYWYWAGQAFCCNQPLCYITLSFFGICIVYIYWWSLYARFIPYLYGFKLFSLSTCSR